MMFKEILNFIKNNKWYVLLVVGLLGLYFYKFHGELSSNSEKWDHFGSYIGGIFSAVTLLSVLHGMQLERKRFNEQRVEFENERKEQEERRRKEDFERTFFMMLEQHNVKLNELLNKKSNENNVIQIIYDEIMDYPMLGNQESLRFRMEVGGLREFYTEINSYFLNLYRIFKYIHEYEDLNVKNRYSSLLRSYLPKSLLVILSYHLYERDNSYDEYIEYINKFSFFEHLDLFVLENKYIHKVTNFSEKDIYSLINIVKLNKREEIDRIIKQAKVFSNNVKPHKLKMIFDSKFDLKPIEANFQDFNIELYYENVFFYTLSTFSDEAFKGNIDYENIKIVYSQFIDNIKSKNAKDNTK